MKYHFALLAVFLVLPSLSCGRRNESDRGPKYGKRDQEVVLPQSVHDGVNCHVEDYSIPWYTAHEDATTVVLGTKISSKPVVRLRSAPVTHEIVRFEYEVTELREGAFPNAVLSFFSLEVYEDGVFYKRLVLPAKCKFFLVESEKKYRIVSIENKGS